MGDIILIRKTINYYKRMKHVSNDFFANRKYLLPGKYKYNKKYGYLCLDDGKTQLKADNIFTNRAGNNQNKRMSYKEHIKACIRYIVFGNLKIEHDEIESKFKGTILIYTGYTNQRTNIKIFDLINSEIATIFVDKEAYRSTISNYEHFYDLYPMPAIKFKDDKNLTIIEEYVDSYQGYEKDNKYYNYVMKEVFNNTIKHFDIAAKNNLFQLATPTDLLKHLPENDEMIKCIWDNLDNKLKDMNFPFLKLHGDLIGNRARGEPPPRTNKATRAQGLEPPPRTKRATNALNQ